MRYRTVQIRFLRYTLYEIARGELIVNEKLRGVAADILISRSIPIPDMLPAVEGMNEIEFLANRITRRLARIESFLDSDGDYESSTDGDSRARKAYTIRGMKFTSRSRR